MQRERAVARQAFNEAQEIALAQRKVVRRRGKRTAAAPWRAEWSARRSDSA